MGGNAYAQTTESSTVGSNTRKGGGGRHVTEDKANKSAHQVENTADQVLEECEDGFER